MAQSARHPILDELNNACVTAGLEPLRSDSTSITAVYIGVDGRPVAVPTNADPAAPPSETPVLNDIRQPFELHLQAVSLDAPFVTTLCNTLIANTAACVGLR